MKAMLSLQPFRFYRNADDDWLMPLVIDPDKSLWIYWPNDEQLDPSKLPPRDPTQEKGLQKKGTSFDLLRELLDGDFQETDLLQSTNGQLLQENTSYTQVIQRHHPIADSSYKTHGSWKHMSKTVTNHHGPYHG